MNSSKPPACVPTWHGHIETTKDALLIFEACFQGILQHCSRRPHDRERNTLIVSGNVFVYEEATSGIKRWTDGIPWSPSRILTNFLIYRQLNSPFPPGEKKRATKRNARPSRPGEPYPAPQSHTGTPLLEDHKPFAPQSPETPTLKRDDDAGSDKEINRGLVGSLIDSYEFKEGGLLKKTMTVTLNNVQHHLVSYYSLEDAKSNLKTPRDDARLKNITLSEGLLNQPKFKFPNLDDAGDGSFENMDASQGQYAGYYQPAGGYGSPYGYHYPPAPYSHSAYPPAHPPASSPYTSMAPSGPTYASTGHYPQHQHPNPYYQPQLPHHQQQQPQHQYYAYSQQAHTHNAHQTPPHAQTAQHTPALQPAQHAHHGQHQLQAHQPRPVQYPQQHGQAHATPIKPVKQENPVGAGSPYNYGGVPHAGVPHANVHQSMHQNVHPNVNNVYGTHPTNGTSSAQDDEVVPASVQPPQASTWPGNQYNSHAAWGRHPGNSQYPPYQPSGPTAGP